MEWSDEGIVLARRKHGEHGAIVSAFTRAHGRHLGIVRGGGGKRHGATLQLGNRVVLRWRARLEGHLGSFTVEGAEAISARLLDDGESLDALASVVALLDLCLPERHAYEPLYDATLALLRGLDANDRAAEFVHWELGLLAALGFGLELDDGEIAGARDRRLAVPRFLIDRSALAEARDIAGGLALTGHFLSRYLVAPHRRALPAARERFVERWKRRARLPAIPQASRDS
jgi:DNA repair protein RecO (recombination protein O)